MSSTSGAPRYLIKTVDDLLSLPPDRVRACLDELGDAVEMFHKIQRLTDIIAESQGVSQAPFSLPYFEWIDDGKKDHTITLPDVAEPEPTPTNPTTNSFHCKGNQND